MGGDRAVEPVCFALDGLGQPAKLLSLIGGDLGRPVVESREPLVQPPDPAVLKPEAALGHAFQKCSVVADDQGGAPAGAELGLQGLDGEDVEVVGRLVQQEHIWLLGEGAGQCRPPRLAAGESGRAALRVETEVVQSRFGLMRFGAARSRIGQQGLALDLRLLGQEHHSRRGRQKAIAGVGLDHAGQDPHEGRLASPVSAHQAGANPRFQGQVDAVEQLARPVGQPHPLEGYHRRAGVHCGAS